MDNLELIERGFKEAGDAKEAARKGAYMRNRFEFYGLPAPKRRKIYQSVITEAKKRKGIDWDFLDKCWGKKHREFQYFVLDYLSAMERYLTYADVPMLERYARSKQWWDSIDGLDRIIGNIAFTDARINDLMLKWSVDDDFWVRRIAIDHQLLRKGKTDTNLLERILVNNFGSKEFFINKAIGWSLRDYSKTNPDWVRAFINRHGSVMNPLSIREASKYI